MKDDDGQYWNALKIDARKHIRADALLKTKEGKKSLKRAKTKGKMADFGDMISNFIEFKRRNRPYHTIRSWTFWTLRFDLY